MVSTKLLHYSRILELTSTDDPDRCRDSSTPQNLTLQVIHSVTILSQLRFARDLAWPLPQANLESIAPEMLRHIKSQGFSDLQISHCLGATEAQVRRTPTHLFFYP